MAQFNRYEANYYSASNVPGYSYDAMVDLYMDDKWVARLIFVKAGQTIPKNQKVGNALTLHFSISEFPVVMSILREEKPLYVGLASSGLGILSTGKEPVGEEEGV